MSGIQLSLRYISIKTNHFDEMLQFYTQVIGLEPLSFENDAVFLGNKEKKEPLLVLVDEGEEAPAQTGFLEHIAFQMTSKQELYRLIKHLEQENISHTKVTEKGALIHFFAKDPEGHEIEFYYNDAPSFHQVIQADEVDSSVDASIEAEKPVQKQLGHIHLSVSNLPEVLKIHQDIFGLQLIEDNKAYHFVNDAHHLMMTLEGESSQPSSSIEFIAFQVETLEELLEIKERLEANHYDYYFNNGKRILQFTDSNYLSYWIYASAEVI